MPTPQVRLAAYERLHAAISGIEPGNRSAFIDLAWNHLEPTGVSWIGFYDLASDEMEMILGPCRNRPACSPIGMHGACGQALRSKKTLIVDDVADLGEAYVACDPSDRSEIVIPICHGSYRSVLDLDSQDPASFGLEDDSWLKTCLARASIRPND